MTVYLVATTSKHIRPKGFFELWADAIKGRYEHIELAFVRNRDVVACYITRSLGKAVFVHRDYEKLRDDCNVYWFLLPNINDAKERELEHRCRELVRAGKHTFSNLRMMSSAFPIPDCEWLLRYAIQFAEPTPTVTAEEKGKGKGKDDGGKLEAEIEKMIRDRADDRHWKSEGTYCAGLCAELLGFARPEERTAADVVELCIRDLGARAVDQPILYSEVRTKDDANIIRSTRMSRAAAGEEDASFYV